jgi:peptidoglycan/LPS O-acetylase OafA/YrhL
MPDNEVGTYALMPCRMDSLALGGLIALLKRESPEFLKGRWIGWVTAAAAATFAAICLFISAAPESDVMRSIGFSAADLTCAGLLIMLVSWRLPVLVAICRQRWLVGMGTISYGLYLLHIPAKIMARHLTRPFIGLIPENGSAELFVSLTAAICLAWISWHVFESPILKLKDRFTVR